MAFGKLPTLTGSNSLAKHRRAWKGWGLCLRFSVCVSRFPLFTVLSRKGLNKGSGAGRRLCGKPPGM